MGDEKSTNKTKNRDRDVSNTREQIKFEQLLNIAPIIIVILDLKGHVIFINNKGTEIIGLPTNKIIGTNWFDNYIPAQSRKLARVAFDKKVAKDDNNADVYETPIENVDKTNILVEWHTVLLKDKANRTNGVFSSGLNITAKKDYERSIKQQRSLLRLIVDKLPLLLAYVSTEMEYLYVNKPYSEFYGQSISFFIHKKTKNVLPNNYFNKIENNLKRAINGEVVEFEIDRVNSKGETITTLTKYIPHVNENGKTIALLAAIEDINEKRKIEHELIEREENLRLLINNTPDTICFKDGDGKWLLANNANLNIFELGGIDYVGKTNLELSKNTSPAYKDAFEVCKESDEKTWESKNITQVEMKVHTSNGENLILDLLKVPIFNEDGSRRVLISRGRNVTEERKAAKALKESEDKFRRIFVESLTPQLLVSAEGMIIDCNDAAYKLLEYDSKDSLIGRSASELSPRFQFDGKPSSSKSIEYIKMALEEGATSFEWIHLTKNKKEVFINISLTLIVVNNENLVHVVWHDISKRVAREKEIKKLHTAIEQSPISIVITDINANIEYVNHGFTVISGYSQEEVIGKNPRILKSGLTAYETYEEMWKSLTSGKTWTGEFTNRRKSGEFYIESCIIVPVKDEHDVIVNYIALKEDVTKQRSAEEQLQESENKFKSLFYDNESIIILFDPESGIIKDANEAACKFYGYSHSEIIQQSVFSFNTKSKKELTGLLNRVRAKQQNHFTFRHKLKNGTFKDVELYTGILNSKKKELFYSVIHDISDKIKAEKDLVAAKERAEESDRLKSAFLANMSHEIRTPMNAILGFAALLKEEDLDPDEKKQFVDIINSSGYSLLEIINDIIEMSKIEAGQISINKKETDIYKLTSTVFSQHTIHANNKNIELKFSPPAVNEELILLVDDIKIKQILTNLMDNAIKFTDDGHVELGYKVHETEIEFFVKDTGIGISKENHQSIFDRFNKISWETGTKKIYPGTGLGLSICKAYLDKMGGTIRVESEKGKGTSFYFTIPKDIIDTRKAPEEKKDNISINLIGKVILVAEDTEKSYLFLEIILSKLGATVLHAWTGNEAIEIMRTRKGAVDLVFMDLKMPGIDGYETTRILKKEFTSIPIIAQTAYAFTEDKLKALKAGCDDFISKPILKEKIVEVLNRYL